MNQFGTRQTDGVGVQLVLGWMAKQTYGKETASRDRAFALLSFLVT